MSEICYEEAQFFEGVLEKKGHGLVAVFQKRYFRLLEGRIMVYTDKKDDIEIKGVFNLDQISNISNLDSKCFKFCLEDRDFVFKAQNEEERNKWVSVLKLLKDKLIEINEQENQLRINVSESANALAHKKSIAKRNKIQSAGKVTAEIIRKYGYVTNKEEKLSKELLKSKGIDKLLNLQDTKINRRIYYGFINKRHKAHDYFQKRWFFIFSRRPLFDNHYLDDDVDLDPKKQKEWIKFDTLYYFKFEEKVSENENLKSLDLGNSHKIELLDKDDKFYLYLDIGDRRFDCYCDTKSERDVWFEVLKNSRRTAREYKVSFTKHPRNIELLNTYFLKGEKDFIKKMEKEKIEIVGKYDEITDFNIFEFNQQNLSNFMLSTIDGCNSNSPPKEDLVKGYCEYMDRAYLDICKSFWDKKYKEIDNNNLLKMSMMIFNFGEQLLKVNVIDSNFYKNGKEFSKIFLKKTYQNVLSIIKNLLKKEREIKAIKDESGLYCTRGPSDLFQLLCQTFDLIKSNKNKCLYELTLDLFNAAINQYLIGEEAVLNNLDIIIEKEFLLAVANNSLNLIQYVNNLLEAAKSMNVLNDEEIYESFGASRVNAKVNKVSQKAITSFVFYFINELGNSFKNTPFMSLDMTKILVVVNDIFGSFKSTMNAIVIKKAWNEILKMTLYHYINNLISSNYDGVTVLEIRIKIKNDIALISETFESLVGKNLTTSTIKILNDIYDFLCVSPSMISSSIFTLRQYIGPTFSISKAAAFMKLRTDFKEEETEDAIRQCQDALRKYTIDFKEDPEVISYFQIMDREIRRQEREKRANEIGEEAKNEENKENTEQKDEEEEEVDVVNYDLDDFLKGDSDEEDEEGKIKQNLPLEKDKEVSQEEVSDIICEGYMDKKTHSSYQARFFQLKNGFLYWFKDQNSLIVQNKIPLKNTVKICSEKSKKFTIVVAGEGEKTDSDLSGKLYKFKCKDEETKNKWMSALTIEIHKFKYQGEKPCVNVLEIQLRKKEIVDHFNLPEIGKDVYFMRNQIIEEMSNENYFQPSLRKIENDKKKKLKQELEMQERRKKEEKEERDRKEEQEKMEELKKKREENKKIQEDIKQGKNVGLTDKLKLWYRTKIEGMKEEDEKPEPQKEENINEMSLTDFLGNN